jgi:hypothetical protein
MGLFNAANNSGVLNAVSRDQGNRSALMSLMRTLGQTIGVPLIAAAFSLAARATARATSGTVDAACGLLLRGTHWAFFVAGCILLAAPAAGAWESARGRTSIAPGARAGTAAALASAQRVRKRKRVESANHFVGAKQESLRHLMPCLRATRRSMTRLNLRSAYGQLGRLGAFEYRVYVIRGGRIDRSVLECTLSRRRARRKPQHQQASRRPARSWPRSAAKQASTPVL